MWDVEDIGSLGWEVGRVRWVSARIGFVIIVSVEIKVGLRGRDIVI